MWLRRTKPAGKEKRVLLSCWYRGVQLIRAPLRRGRLSDLWLVGAGADRLRTWNEATAWVDQIADDDTFERAPFVCSKCGERDLLHAHDWVIQMCEVSGFCQNCVFWAQFFSDSQKEAWRHFVADGHGYSIGSGASKELRGFGGRRFVAVWLDGTHVEDTTDLWHRGTVPPHWRPELPDTARLIAR